MQGRRKIQTLISYYGKGVTPAYVADSSIVVLNQKCIRNNKIDYSFLRFINDEKEYNQSKFLQKGDILINSTGQGTAGRVAFVDEIPTDKKILIDSHILVIRLKNFYEARCLNYFLFSIENMLQTFMDGSTGQGEFDKIRLFNLNVPFSENGIDHQKIASILSSLDSKIELNTRINVELEAMAKTIYDYWFVQFDFPDKNNKPYKTSGGKMIWNEELKREIPEGWQKGFLSSLGEIIGGSTPPRESEEYFTTNGTAWITPKDLSLNTGNKFITKGELDVSDKGIKAASLNIMPKGTILLSSRAPVGYLAISREDVTTNQGFKSFIPNKGFTTEFVYYSIKNMIPAIENNAVGSTFKEISAATLKTIIICLPTRKVVNNYTEIVKSIFERQNNLEIETQKLTELRNWLLPMLINGQVCVGKAYEEVEGVFGMVAEDEGKSKKVKKEIVSLNRNNILI